MGVWIEILTADTSVMASCVAPFVGVWIEITPHEEITDCDKKSLPLWECGLKSQSSACYGSVELSLPLWECGLKW